MIAELESFLETFRQYAKEVYKNKFTEEFETLRSRLQRLEPKITDMILRVLGNGQFMLMNSAVAYKDLLSTALLNSYPPHFTHYDGAVTQLVERAIGTLKEGLWPPKTPPPVLTIHDPELQGRCGDLLRAPGNYDRVIREATTVLEDRMRNRPPHEILARLIPNAADQIGEQLVNKLFAPDNSILSISSDKTKRIAFHKILIGVVSYLRHPYHHRLDAETQWSWAWSVVGFIDQLLANIDNCTLTEGDVGGHS
jgi:hypothetical protein